MVTIGSEMAEKNRVDWARIIEDMEKEACGGVDSPGEWKLVSVLKDCLACAFRRISRKEIIKILKVLIPYIVGCILGFLILALVVWLIESMITEEAKKPQTEVRYSSSEKTVKSESKERNAFAEKEKKRDFKLCVINGERYMMYSDGTIWEQYNGGWMKLYYPPGWLMERIRLTPHNGFWSPL